MLVLAIDTSSPDVVAAVFDGAELRVGSTQQGAQAHGELLAPSIEHVLRVAASAPGDLSHVVVGVGPGPFTGLRVGLVTAEVMADALGIPVLGVCSLDVVAAGAVGSGCVDGPFAVVTDARRREVYVARYDRDGRRTGPPSVARAADLPDAVRRGPVVGPGAALYPEAFSDVRSTDGVEAAWLGGVAVDVVRDTGAVMALDTTPLYLRRPDAVEGGGHKRVTPS